MPLLPPLALEMEKGGPKQRNAKNLLKLEKATT
jgi:hypothetical protein